MYRYGALPTKFYHDWLHTDPQLTPEMRRKQAQPKAQLDWRIAVALAPVVLLLPLLSPLLAALAVLGICAWSCRQHRCGLDLLPLAHDVLTRFLTYGMEPSGAPGTWRPRLTFRRRNTLASTIVAAVFVPLSLGLCYYFPCRIMSGPMWESLERDLRAAATVRGHYAHPDLQLQDAPFKDKDKFPGFLAGRMTSSPHVWPLLVAYEFRHGNFGYSWLLVLAVVLGIMLPPWVLLSLYRLSLLELHRTALSLEEELQGDTRSEWQWYVDRLRLSDHVASDPLTGNDVREAKHLFLGVESVLKFPVLLDRQILDEHAYIAGETGSGKTSLGIMPLLIQLIRGHALPKRETEPAEPAKLAPPPPMVIIDLKGDPALFNTVLKEVADRRRQLGITDENDPHCAFRFFTSEKGRATHHFNPFKSLESSSRSLIQVCHLFLDSLSLSHGEGYGRSYYSRKNRHLLYEALESKPVPRSFTELYERITDRAVRQPEVYRDCFELISTIHALTKYPQVATFEPLKRPEDAIHMPSVLEYGQVVYFWLPAVLESISVREIAKLALFCMLTAAIDRQRAGQETGQAYLVIDEFQRIAGENFRIILEQARSFGISAILCNQTQADLKTPDVDLRSTVRTNTRYKQYFGLSEPHEIADLCEVSGQELSSLHSWTMQASGVHFVKQRRFEPWREFTTKSETEFIKSRLTINDVIRTSDHPLDSIIHVSRGSGYTQYGGFPVPIRSVWPMDEGDYRERQKDEWPMRDEYELETVVAEQGPPEIDQEAQCEAERQQAQIDERIKELFARQQPREKPCDPGTL